MPVAAGQQYDVQLNQKGFMLWRDPKSRAQAWNRTGISDSLSSTKRTARAVYGLDVGEDYGGLPDDLDHPEAHEDWSGGYGDYRSRNGRRNHYHVAFNTDTRFPGMWFHAQQPNLLPSGVPVGQVGYASVNINAGVFLDVPLFTGTAAPPGAGMVVVAGAGHLTRFTPTPYQLGVPLNIQNYGSAFDYLPEGSGNASFYANANYRYNGRASTFGSFSYIPASNGNAAGLFAQRDFTGTIVFSTLTARWFTVAGSRLWRGHGTGLVQSCAAGADPMVAANWSATLQLGDGQMVSQDAIAFEDHIFVAFPDGLYMGDQTGTFNNVATDVGVNVNPDNVRDITVHNGMVVFAAGSNVWGYKPSSGANSEIRPLWPRVDIRPISTLGAFGGAPISTICGRVQALKGFGRWLYAGVFDGTHSMIYCGYEASQGLPYVWHPMQTLGDSLSPAHVTKVSRIHVDAITAASNGARIPRRIWVATDASYGSQAGATAPVYFWPIPENDEQPFADLTFSPHYCPQAYLEESIRDWDSPGTWKVWRKTEAMADGITASLAAAVGAPLGVALVVDGTMSAPFDSAGQFFTNGGPKDFHYFTNANMSAVGQAAQLSYLSAIGNVSLNPTPIYRAIVERGTERPRSNDVITMKVHIADHLHDRQRGEMRDGRMMLKELREMALSSNPYPFVDLVGDTYPVVVQPTIEEEEVYQGGSDVPDIIATVKLGVLDASWPVSVQTPFHPRGG